VVGPTTERGASLISDAVVPRRPTIRPGVLVEIVTRALSAATAVAETSASGGKTPSNESSNARNSFQAGTLSGYDEVG